MKLSTSGRGIRSRMAIAIAVVAMATALAAPVSASDTNAGSVSVLVDQIGRSADPGAAFAALSPVDQAAVQAFLTAISVDDSMRLDAQPSVTAGGRTMTAAATSCWTWTWQRDAKNNLGATLWSYFQRIDWCGNGTVITTTPHGVQRTRWGETYYAFWQWNHIDNQTWGGTGQSSYRAFTQGEFRLCLTGNIGCIQYSYPWLDMTAWANGNGTGTVGG